MVTGAVLKSKLETTKKRVEELQALYDQVDLWYIVR